MKTDIRIIAASNIDLEEMSEKKLFRKDLFYRLNVIPVFIPPLRDAKRISHCLSDILQTDSTKCMI